MKPADLARLRAVAAVAYEAELVKVRANAAAAAAVDAKVQVLREARRDRASETRALDTPDPAQLASADLHWNRWTEERLHRLQAERARLAAEAEAIRAATRKAFGRGQALDGVAQKLSDAQKAKARRAEEAEG